MALISFVAQALLLLLVTVLLVIPLLYVSWFIRRSENALLPTDWPIVGLLPTIISVINSHSFHDTLTSALAVAAATKQLSFRVRGPPRTSLSFFVLTCDPQNVRHIFTTNFANYPKGADFAAMFGLLQGTIFTADGEAWRRQRGKIHHVLTSPRLLDAFSRTCRDKVAAGLVPLLSRMAASGTAFDIQDVLGRLVLDMTVVLVFGEAEDPRCLPASEPMPVAAALDAVMEVAFFRHMVPPLCWKVMRRFRVGPERKAAAAEAVLWDFVAERIQRRMAATGRRTTGKYDDDILSHYMDDDDCFMMQKRRSSNDDDDGGDRRRREPTEFMHRTFINFLVALRDPVASALPWFVYNLAMHPRVVSAVRKELALVVAAAPSSADAGGDSMVTFQPKELERLVYLRAALFESLRLHPPGPIERKVADADDVLPSGHTVHAGDTVLVLVYSMARMESVWGEDCREYRPERWLSDYSEGREDDGDDRPAAARLRFVPSYKFLSFNTGPRSCLGKKIAVAQMMCIAAAVAWNFDVEVVEGHAVVPKLSAVMQMKNGLMVKVNKRGPERTSSGHPHI